MMGVSADRMQVKISRAQTANLKNLRKKKYISIAPRLKATACDIPKVVFRLFQFSPSPPCLRGEKIFSHFLLLHWPHVRRAREEDQDDAVRRGRRDDRRNDFFVR